MAINPFWDPFSSGAAAGSSGAGAAGMAGEAQSLVEGAGPIMPCSVLIPMAISAITSLLGGQSQEKKQQEALDQIMKFLKPEFSRYTSGIQEIDPAIRNALTSRLSQTQGWGWPAQPGIGGQ